MKEFNSLLGQTPNLGVCQIKSELFPRQITSYMECPYRAIIYVDYLSRERVNIILFIIFFTILIIVLIMSSIETMVNMERKREGFKEGAGIDWPKVPSPSEIADQMKGFFNMIGDKAKAAGDTVMSGINGVVNDLKGKFQELADKAKALGEQITSEFKKIGNEITSKFAELTKRMNKMGSGLKGIFDGIGMEFTGMGEGLRLGFDDIGLLFQYTGEFLLTYCFCGVKFITNLNNCILYYAIDAIGQIIYLPFRVMFFVIWLSVYKDIYSQEAKIWSQIHDLDQMNYNYTGIYLTRWPRTIRDLCYNCKRLKVSVLNQKAKDINDDFNIKMPELLNKGVRKMQESGDDFTSAFK